MLNEILYERARATTAASPLRDVLSYALKDAGDLARAEQAQGRTRGVEGARQRSVHAVASCRSRASQHGGKPAGAAPRAARDRPCSSDHDTIIRRAPPHLRRDHEPAGQGQRRATAPRHPETLRRADGRRSADAARPPGARVAPRGDPSASGALRGIDRAARDGNRPNRTHFRGAFRGLALQNELEAATSFRPRCRSARGAAALAARRTLACRVGPDAGKAGREEQRSDVLERPRELGLTRTPDGNRVGVRALSCELVRPGSYSLAFPPVVLGCDADLSGR